jgi:hypothetical protein
MEHWGFAGDFLNWHDFLVGLIVYVANYFATKHGNNASNP